MRLMSPEYVRPDVKAQKNDDRDAEAIAEAATRLTMRFVRVKSQEQSEIQALHRARSRLIAERTALINHLRGPLLERGIAAPKGRRKFEDQLEVFADETKRVVNCLPEPASWLRTCAPNGDSSTCESLPSTLDRFPL